MRVRQYTKEQAVEFGLRLREIREQDAHLSQRELSFPGCTAAYISRVEKGERYPSVVLIRGLAKRLGVTPEYLETGDGARLSVDVLLSRVCEATGGLSLIAFREGDRPGVDVHFEYAGSEKIATGDTLADALFGAATWAGRVAELERLAEERQAESAVYDAELERLLGGVVVNL